MFDFHKDKLRYFEMQYLTARDYVIPFIENTKKVEAGLRVLEIGCAEAGVLKAFRERGCHCTGIELSTKRLETARAIHESLEMEAPIEFVSSNIYDIDPDRDMPDRFDIIILKDVIEHIPDQGRFIPTLRPFLKPGGVVFFGFPPWYMPFGGHQQVANNKVMRSLPYYHILPTGIYRGLLKAFGESDQTVSELMEVKETGISIERFERIVKRSGMRITHKKSWLLNPIYKYKFGKGPVGQAALIAGVPGLRNFLTTAVYYTIEAES